MVTVSTSSRDQEHFQETMATLDANHVGGGASIWVLDGVKPELWVDGGGHRDDVFALMEAHLTPLWDKGNTKLPQTLLDHSFTMVDGWLETRCREGSLRCYSLECAFDPPAGQGCLKAAGVLKRGVWR